MAPDDFAVLDLVRCELTLRALQSADLPPFLGSTLRGAFGHALKQAVCVMDHRRCERCILADRCIYPYLFETPVPPDVSQLRGQRQAPHPFILTPPMLVASRGSSPRGAQEEMPQDAGEPVPVGAREPSHLGAGASIPPSARESLPVSGRESIPPSSNTSIPLSSNASTPQSARQSISMGARESILAAACESIPPGASLSMPLGAAQAAPVGVPLNGHGGVPTPFVRPEMPGAQEARYRPTCSPAACVTRRRMSTHDLSDGGQVRLIRSTPDETPGRRRLARGDALTFGLVLMGRAIDYLPYIVFAVSEMGRRGLGGDRARFRLEDVVAIEPDGSRQPIYSRESGRISAPASATSLLSDLIRLRVRDFEKHEPAPGAQAFCVRELGSFDSLLGAQASRLPASGAVKSPVAAQDAVTHPSRRLHPRSLPDSLTVRFITPARIRVEGDLQVGMSFQLLVRNLLRRVSMLAAVHGSGRLELDYRGLIERAGEVKTRCSALKWFDWDRYSNRQQTKMSLGGFVGEIEYEGEILSEFLPLMAGGEMLHVGAGTSFGLGRYQLRTECQGVKCPESLRRSKREQMD